MSAFPPVIQNAIGRGLPGGVFAYGNDSSKYLIERRRFQRPTLGIIGGDEFEWPLGIEGFTISGTASLAEHLYIGDNAAVLQVMHRDNRRIVMSGMFPGETGSQNVNDLLEILTAQTPDNGKILTLPKGAVLAEQIVVPETWNFDHAENAPDDSWQYTVTFRRVGVRGKLASPKFTAPPVVPKSTKSKPKGKSGRVFTVRAGVNTLRAVAQVVFRNPNRWREIYDKNEKAMHSMNVPLVQAATKRLPNGMKLYY